MHTTMLLNVRYYTVILHEPTSLTSTSSMHFKDTWYLWDKNSKNLQNPEKMVYYLNFIHESCIWWTWAMPSLLSIRGGCIHDLPQIIHKYQVSLIAGVLEYSQSVKIIMICANVIVCMSHSKHGKHVNSFRPLAWLDSLHDFNYLCQ